MAREVWTEEKVKVERVLAKVTDSVIRDAGVDPKSYKAIMEDVSPADQYKRVREGMKERGLL